MKKETGPGIISIGKYLPPDVLTNEDFKRYFGINTSDEWIYPRTGIKQRHIAIDENTSDLATKAAKEALERCGMESADLAQIIVATATPDSPFPPTSSKVQTNLNARKAAGFDLSNACNGGLAGLEEGYLHVAGGSRANAMVIGVEVLSRYVNYRDSDRDTCVLFGDGAGAVLVAPVENPGPYAFAMGADGSKGENIIYRGGGSIYPASKETLEAGLFKIEMQGRAVYEDAVNSMYEMTERVLEMAGLSKHDVDLWVPHQANMRIMKAAAKKLGFQDNKMISYIKNMGNISAASIFVAMYDAFIDGWLQKGDIIAMAAIGSGYHFGGGVIQWQIENPKPRPAGKFSH